MTLTLEALESLEFIAKEPNAPYLPNGKAILELVSMARDSIRYRKALEFYAFEKNWLGMKFENGIAYDVDNGEGMAHADAGNLARKALRE